MIVRCVEEEKDKNFFTVINVDIADIFHKNKNINVTKTWQNQHVQYVYKF